MKTDLLLINPPITLEERYGDSFFLQIGVELYEKEINQFLDKLETKDKIKLIKKGYNEEFLRKRIENVNKIDIDNFHLEKTKVNLKNFFDIDLLIMLKNYKF